MKVVILGAGASVHVGYPLAAEMGTRLAAWVDTLPPNHDLRWAIEKVREEYKGLDEFESILADLMSRPTAQNPTVFERMRPYILSGLQEGLRQYFDTIRVNPAPLYNELARALDPGDCVITFNYDLSVEKALRGRNLWRVSTGYGFPIEGDEGESPVEVLKLHGSTNWRALLFEGRQRGGFIVNGVSLGYRPVLFFRSDLDYLEYPSFVDPKCASMDSAATNPVMILPALPKQFYFETSFGKEWQEFWSTLWDRAQKMLEVADDITVIGYSFPAADEAARNLVFGLRNKTAKLRVCCGNASARIREEFRSNGFSPDDAAPITFAGYVAGLKAAKAIG